MLTDWVHSKIGPALIAKERQLRLGVASQLAESLWLHQQRVGQRRQDDSAVVRAHSKMPRPNPDIVGFLNHFCLSTS